MKNLIVLTKMNQVCASMASDCAYAMLNSHDKEMLIQHMARVLAMLDILAVEYDINKSEDVLPIYHQALTDLEGEINRLMTPESPVEYVDVDQYPQPDHMQAETDTQDPDQSVQPEVQGG